MVNPALFGGARRTDTELSPPAPASLIDTLLAEVLRDAHRYNPGVEHYRPTLLDRPRARSALISVREYFRDVVERAANRIGFTRRNFDPDVASARLTRVLEVAEGFEATYSLLADDPSRRDLIDLLKHRVLGPRHAPLRITPVAYRAKQAYADHELCEQRATVEVSDPWFSPLSLYRVPVDGGPPIALHSHSVDVVSVYLLNQYTYARGANRVAVEPGDVVLDVGGCWGDTALYFASLVGRAGKVYTFEFDPESLEVLRANLALNRDLATRIEVVERALWDTSGETLGFVPSGRMTSVTGPGAHRAGLTVPTITLDDFVASAGIDRLGFVKMDVEGAESNVLRGARASLKRFTPKLALAAYHNDDDLVELPAAIDSLGLSYRFFVESFSPVEEETVLFATSG